MSPWTLSSSLVVRSPITPPLIFSSIAVADKVTAVGSSLVLITVKVKVSLAVKAPSEPVILTCKAPTSAFNGVPVKVRVAASKLNQAGRAVLSLKLAE